MPRSDEFKHTFPKSPTDGDIHADVDGMQWIFIGEVNESGYDLTDEETYRRYTYPERMPNGSPDDEIGIRGSENVFRWLNENL